MGLIHELTFLFTMNRRLWQQDNTHRTEFTELWEPSTPKQLQFQGCTFLVHYVYGDLQTKKPQMVKNNICHKLQCSNFTVLFELKCGPVRR